MRCKIFEVSVSVMTNCVQAQNIVTVDILYVIWQTGAGWMWYFGFNWSRSTSCHADSKSRTRPCQTEDFSKTDLNIITLSERYYLINMKKITESRGEHNKHRYILKAEAQQIGLVCWRENFFLWWNRVKWFQQQRRIRIRRLFHAASTMRSMWAKPRPYESIWIL